MSPLGIQFTKFLTRGTRMAQTQQAHGNFKQIPVS